MHVWRNVGIKKYGWSYRTGKEINEKYSLVLFGFRFYFNSELLFKILFYLEYKILGAI